MNKKLVKTLSAFLAGTMVLAGASCAKKGDGKIKWVIPATLSGDGQEAVFEKVNEILKEKYDLELDLIAIPSADFDQKLTAMNAAREEYDIVYTAHWKNNYYANVSNGNLIELTEDMLKEYAPKTYEFLDDAAWDATRVDGKIYAVPNWQMMTRATGLYLPTEYVELTGVNAAEIKDFDGLTDYMRKLHAKKPEVNEVGPMWTQAITHYNLVDVYEEKMPGVIDFTKEGKPVVFNQYESDIFEDYVAMRNDWIKEGLVTDVYNPDSKAAKKEFKTAYFTGGQYSPMGESTVEASHEYDFTAVQFSPIVMAPTGVTAALSGISSTSKQPEKALQMIEIMNNDPEIFNLIAYGIEGVDYDKISDNIIKLREDKKYTGPSLFTMASMGNAYLTDEKFPNIIEDMDAHNKKAVVSPLMGFNANTDSLQVQIANCRTVVNKYLDMLDRGIHGEKELKEFQQELKKAGVDEIIAEVQRQIDEWWAKNN